jgi:hypothetical protein
MKIMKIFIDLCGMLEFSSLASFQVYVCFRVWEGGFESSNSNEMVARRVVATTNIACIVKVVDARKMVKLQYEATTNLFLLVAFVFLLHSRPIQP